MRCGTVWCGVVWCSCGLNACGVGGISDAFNQDVVVVGFMMKMCVASSKSSGRGGQRPLMAERSMNKDNICVCFMVKKNIIPLLLNNDNNVPCSFH